MAKTKLETARDIIESVQCNEDLPFHIFTQLLDESEALDAMPDENCGNCVAILVGNKYSYCSKRSGLVGKEEYCSRFEPKEKANSGC